MDNIPKETDAPKILIVQIGKLGDMILTTPLFSNLKLLYPNCEIHVLASQLNYEIPLYHKDVQSTHIYKKGSLRTIPLLMRLRQNRFDYWIDTKVEYSRTSRTLVRYAKPIRSLGYNNDDNLFDIDLAEYKIGIHAVEINLTPLKVLAPFFTIESKRPTLFIPGKAKEKVKPFLNEIPGKKTLLNISAGKTNRIWGREKWKKLLELFNEDDEWSIIINAYGYDDKEVAKMLIEQVKNKNIYWYSGKYMEIAEIVKYCNAVISADTSIVHMASAFNVPVVDMFTNVKWNIERFAPLSDKSEIIVSEDKDSLKTITPEMVFRALQELKIS